MIDVRLKELLDPDRHFLVRVCMRVSDLSSDAVAPGSAQDACGECDAPIWVDLTQSAPSPPEGLVLEGEILLCLLCTLKFNMLLGEPPTLLE